MPSSHEPCQSIWDVPDIISLVVTFMTHQEARCLALLSRKISVAADAEELWMFLCQRDLGGKDKKRAQLWKGIPSVLASRGGEENFPTRFYKFDYFQRWVKPRSEALTIIHNLADTYSLENFGGFKKKFDDNSFPEDIRQVFEDVRRVKLEWFSWYVALRQLATTAICVLVIHYALPRGTVKWLDTSNFDLNSWKFFGCVGLIYAARVLFKRAYAIMWGCGIAHQVEEQTTLELERFGSKRNLKRSFNTKMFFVLKAVNFALKSINDSMLTLLIIPFFFEQFRAKIQSEHPYNTLLLSWMSYSSSALFTLAAVLSNKFWLRILFVVILALSRIFPTFHDGVIAFLRVPLSALVSVLVVTVANAVAMKLRGILGSAAFPVVSQINVVVVMALLLWGLPSALVDKLMTIPDEFVTEYVLPAFSTSLFVISCLFQSYASRSTQHLYGLRRVSMTSSFWTAVSLCFLVCVYQQHGFIPALCWRVLMSIRRV